MNEDRPLNGENHNHFPLARKPSSAVEKAAPGAKRILSGMVADALALTKNKKRKKLRIVVMDDEEGPRRSCAIVLKGCCPNGAEILEFDDSLDAWKELSRTDPDLFITDIQHVGISCKEMLARLAERKVKYPVLVISAVLGFYEQYEKYPEMAAWVNEVRRDWRPNLNVTFLSKPYTLKEFRTAFETALKMPRDTVGSGSETPPGVASQMESWCQNGENHYYGRGVPKNYAQAAMWFHMAAEQGHAAAQNYLGICYQRGLGIQQNLTEAVKWYRKAAESGFASAQSNLSYCYANGQGISENLVEAAKWCRKAAEQSSPMGQFNLGVLYLEGRGVPQDYTEAVNWFRRAADQDHAAAQKNLGICYDRGWGVPQNNAEAAKWYKKAKEPRNTPDKEAIYDTARPSKQLS